MKKAEERDYLPFVSGRLKHWRLGGEYSGLFLTGAWCGLSNKVWSLWSPPRSKCHMDQSKAHRPRSPPASPQVVQTRKHSGEVRIAQSRTPYKFLLILALAGLTAESALEGQGGHTSYRGQASCCLPSANPHETGSSQRQAGFPALMSSSQLGSGDLTTVVFLLLSGVKVLQQC